MKSTMTGFILAVLSLLACVPARAAEETRSFIALAYHNIEDSSPDQRFVGVTTERLVEQLSWLQMNGYHMVSIDDLLAARDGGAPLPDKAVLLVFDDGYASFYTRVFPILKAFGFPAVLALVGDWLEGGTTPVDLSADESALAGRDDGTVQFGDLTVDRSLFLTWDQIRKVQASGLVEIASHTYGGHRGAIANPQGNSEPAVTTLRFDPQSGTYESSAAERARLEADSTRMVQRIEQETGTAPRVMVWPYGERNDLAISIAAATGMPITLTLQDGLATVDSLSAVPRHLINPDPPLKQFVAELRTYADKAPVRVVQVDLDYVYDPDPVQQERNVGLLVERIYQMQISTVFLQAFADPTGSGLARELYFPNRVLPMRADLFNRVAWQLRTRAHVEVFAWMPVLAFDLGTDVAGVLAWNPQDGSAKHEPGAYLRASPFDPEARRRIAMIYEDLARQAPIAGLLFHDDAVLSDFEDASAPALAAYARAGFPATIEAIRADPEILRRWTRFKTDALIAFTHELASRVRHYRSPLLTARNIYARPVLGADAETWFAQNYDSFLAAYDYTAIMAMPALENVETGQADAWLRRLVAAVATRPQGLERTIFELQAVDWREATAGRDGDIPTQNLEQQMRLLLRLGALNFGYYPDDFTTDHPDEELLHRSFSLQSYPYLP